MFIDIFLDFPVLIFGQILKNKKFKPMCICVSNKEDILAYQFVFEYIAENARIPPSHLMADAAQSITTAARNIFPEIIRLTCFFHIKQIFR